MKQRRISTNIQKGSTVRDADPVRNGMAEATRLTREGRLAEATALIQQTLGGGFSRSSGAASERPEAVVIETTSRVTKETSRPDATPTAPSSPVGREAGRNLRRAAPAKERHHRGASRPPVFEPEALEDTAGNAGESSGGRFIWKTYSNEAGTRAYRLYVPGGYVGQEVPLVVMLHGCTQSPDDFATGTGMDALAEEHTFLVAYPEQASNANMSRCWNWFRAGDQVRGRGEPSIIAGIACEVVGEYNVGPGRVYVAGMSAGGAMAAVMGEEYPDLFAAIGVHSGLAPGAAQDLSSALSAMQGGQRGSARRTARQTDRTVPVISFHGDRDATVHPSNADRLLAHFRGDGKLDDTVRVREARTPGGHAYVIATRHDAEGRSVAEQWTVRGLGHAWSGGHSPGSYTDGRGPDASAEMVRFFLDHQATPG